jgi:hypothetical protein
MSFGLVWCRRIACRRERCFAAAGMVRANVTIIVLSRGPGSRGRDGNSIDGSYGEGMEEAYL